jgi:hypothetical protein
MRNFSYTSRDLFFRHTILPTLQMLKKCAFFHVLEYKVYILVVSEECVELENIRMIKICLKLNLKN